MWVYSSIILIGAISLAWSLVVALDDDFNFIIEKEYKNKTTFLLKIVPSPFPLDFFLAIKIPPFYSKYL